MRIFRMTLECLSPLHCGGGEESWLQDQPVVRDAFGYWIIPGTSVAGALRELAEQLDGAAADSLFGGKKASMFWASDARLLDYDGRPVLDKLLAGEKVELPQGPFLRDHVRLNSENETAEDRAKFDEEIVPAGTRFALEFAFDPWDRSDVERELALFDQVCALAAQGGMSLGGHGTNGMGAYRALCTECRDFDLTSFAGMQAWLELSSGAFFSGSDGGTPVAVPETVFLMQGDGFSGALTIPFEADGPLIVGGGSSLRGEDDLVFASTPFLDYETKGLKERFVVPGSSVKGAFRHAMYRICRERGLAAEDAEKLMSSLFGHAENQGGRKGRLLFHDVKLGDVRPVSVPHVAVDRFSGGALDGALFSEGPVWRKGMSTAVSVSLQGVASHELALLFHALFDMAEGGLPLGGGTGRGCGRLVLRDWKESPEKALSRWECTLFQNGKPVCVSDTETMLSVFAQLDEELSRVLQA